MNGRRTALVTWDWKEQPDIGELGRVVAELFGGHLREVDTGSDQFAILLSTGPVTDEQASELYDWHMSDPSCVCTDSIRSRIGTCPAPGDREYASCPKRPQVGKA